MDTVVIARAEGAEPLPLLSIPGARVQTGGSIVLEREAAGGARRQLRIVTASSAEAASAATGRAADALVLDCRRGGVELCLEIARRLFPAGALSGPVLPTRTLVVVEEGAEGTAAAFELGRLGMGRIAIAPPLVDLLGRLDGMLGQRAGGRIAVCLAGGGIEGLLWELGVLRALDASLPDRSLVDLDFFCGISAGAIIGALLANGIGPDEIARALIGKSVRVEPIRRHQLFDPDLGEVARRLAGMTMEILRRGPRRWPSALMHAIPPAVFAGRGLERWIERQLTSPGASNRFEDLRRPLYVSATDQDTSEAQLFSAATTPEVPIHKAVRASAALSPFYAPVKIGERYYIDGSFSRTTNMRVAVDEGATLAILIDPLIPIRAPEAGYVFRRGGVFSTMQGLKALVNGRFDKAVRAIRAMYPDIAFHLFRPEADDMRILAGSPMKLFWRQEVEEIAYRTTLSRLPIDHPTLTRDFALHGVRFKPPGSQSLSESPPKSRVQAFDLSAFGVEPAIGD